MGRTVLLLASTALTVLLASGVALAFPVEEAEPNDSIAQAQNIDGSFGLDNDPNVVDSTTVPHATVHGSGNDTHDYYAFTVTQAGVNTTGVFDIDGANYSDGSNFDSYLRLYDQNGNLLASNDDASVDPGSPSIRDSYLQYGFQSAGTYYITVGRCCVSPVPGSSTYRLNVSSAGAGTSGTPPPPGTTLTETPNSFSSNVSPRFSFTSSDANATFECRRDDQAFQSCASPKQLFLLSEGQHTFQVRAKDASGNVDPTPAEHTWTVDSIDPKITFTEKPAAVTNDRTPSWAWTVEEANPGSYSRCYFYDETNNRELFSQYGSCPSPFNFEADLPDGEYSFSTAAEDRAGNYASNYNYFEVDNVAPKVASGTPTGKRVGRWDNVIVNFSEDVNSMNKFVNIYKRGSSTPLSVYRWTNSSREIELAPKNALKSDTWYTVKVATGVTDGANNLEAPYSWNFKTK